MATARMRCVPPLLCLLCAIPGAEAAMTAAEKAAVLARHNALRGNQSSPCTATDMRKLVWSDQLAAVAQNYADTCTWAHNPNRNAQAGYPAGENLYASSVSQTTEVLVSGTQGWYDEILGYNFATGSCDTSVVPMCGHYTQVVWAATTTLGCGTATCGDISGAGFGGTILVCNYAPPGRCLCGFAPSGRRCMANPHLCVSMQGISGARSRTVLVPRVPRAQQGRALTASAQAPPTRAPTKTPHSHTTASPTVAAVPCSVGLGTTSAAAGGLSAQPIASSRVARAT